MNTLARKIITEVRQLITQHNAESLTLYMRLRVIELEMSGAKVTPWADTPSRTFVGFLRHHFKNSIDTVRYSNVVTAADQWGEDFLRKVGIEAVKTLVMKAILKTDERKASLRLLIEKDIRTNRVAPTPERIAELARQVAPELKRERMTGSAPAAGSRIRELEAENKNLKAEVARLEEELAQSKANEARLEKELRAFRRKTTPLKAVRNSATI